MIGVSRGRYDHARSSRQSFFQRRADKDFVSQGVPGVRWFDQGIMDSHHPPLLSQAQGDPNALAFLNDRGVGLIGKPENRNRPLGRKSVHARNNSCDLPIIDRLGRLGKVRTPPDGIRQPHKGAAIARKARAAKAQRAAHVGAANPPILAYGGANDGGVRSGQGFADLSEPVGE